MKPTIATLFFVVLIVLQEAEAQENSPVVIPTELQKLATELPVAERLGIKWGEATIEDTGRYMGFLAAANEIALTIAAKNDRAEPDGRDYVAALASLCIWPPNKPPFEERFWPVAMHSFYNAAVREAIKSGVGPRAISLPALFGNVEGIMALKAGEFPDIEEQYFNEVLDLRMLPRTDQ